MWLPALVGEAIALIRGFVVYFSDEAKVPRLNICLEGTGRYLELTSSFNAYVLRVSQGHYLISSLSRAFLVVMYGAVKTDKPTALLGHYLGTWSY